MNFKKFSSKVTAVAATMAVVASISAISASAADYAVDPKYEAPSQDVVSGSGNVRSAITTETTPAANTDTANADTSETTEEEVQQESPVENGTATVIAAETVSEAITAALESGEGVANIVMPATASGSVTLKEDTVAAIKESEVPVTVSSTATSGITYDVTINPDDVSDADGSINIGMDIEKPDKNAKLDGVPIPKNSLVIAPKTKSSLGFSVALTLPDSALSGLNKKKVAVFAVDKNGNVVKVENGITFNDDGTFTINVDGSVDIIISDKDIVKAANKVASKSSAKATGARPGTGKGVAALGLIDASAISAAAILSKKKKKK